MIAGVLILALACALAYGGWFCQRPPSVAGSAVKTAAVALLGVVAIALDAPILLILALGLSALGDFLLSRLGERAFLAGMAAFFAAHIAYVTLFVALSDTRSGLTVSLTASVLLLVAAGLVYLYLWPGLGTFRVPVALYSMAIAALGIAALTLPPVGPARLILWGAMAFILSDTILAVEKFRLATGSVWRRATPHAIWGLYWLAQSAILLGVVSIAPV